MTVIYIDRVFVLNLALDYMLLLICARLAGTPLRRLRFLLCAAGGAFYAAAVFLPGCAALNGPVFRLLAGLAMAAFLFYKPKKTTVCGIAAAPAVYSGTALFVSLMVVGLGLLDAGLIALAVRAKKRGIIVLLVVSFVCSLCMGYLSSRDFSAAAMNWIAEGVNIVGQGTFLAAAVLLRKAGKEAAAAA